MTDSTQGNVGRHTPGPLRLWQSENDSYPEPHNGDRRLLGADRICLGILFGGYETLPQLEHSQRLLAASYTSYDKHFGARAVEAAEKDLLGEALSIIDGIGAMLESEACISALYGIGHDIPLAAEAEFFRLKITELLTHLPQSDTGGAGE